MNNTVGNFRPVAKPLNRFLPSLLLLEFEHAQERRTREELRLRILWNIKTRNTFEQLSHLHINISIFISKRKFSFWTENKT